VAVARLDDLSLGSEALPPTDGLRWYLEDDSRVIVRPSGTEPKVKVYLEVVEPVSERSRLAEAKSIAGDRLARIRKDMTALTQL
jgi:phosphomannomutase